MVRKKRCGYLLLINQESKLHKKRTTKKVALDKKKKELIGIRNRAGNNSNTILKLVKCFRACSEVEELMPHFWENVVHYVVLVSKSQPHNNFNHLGSLCMYAFLPSQVP